MNPEDIMILVRTRKEQALETLAEAESMLKHEGMTARGVVNRSYYACFYAVLSLLQLIGEVPRKHTGAIALFDREFVRNGKFPAEFSAVLHRLFDMRMEDDYKRLEPVERVDAEIAAAESRKFVERVCEFLKTQGH